MGFQVAENYHEIPEAARMGGFDLLKFEQWVVSKYNPRRLSHNSRSLAEHLAGSDTDGFDLWFRWYDEYRGIAPSGGPG
jgi:hypothetical protein